MRRRIGLTVLALFTLVGLLYAAEPVFLFEGPDNREPDPAFQAWHPQFEKDGDYGESWFYMLHTQENGVLFILFSITNLGIRTFDGRVDIQFYAPDGQVHRMHKEYKRGDVKASTERMDVAIGKSATKRTPTAYEVAIDEKEMSIHFQLANELPGLLFGDGKVTFFKDKSSEWTVGLNAPRGRVTGTLVSGGKTFKLDGIGYHDHGWATIKIPEVYTKWYSIRLYDPKYTLVLHHIYGTKKFGSQDVKFGVLGAEGKILAKLREFTFKPTAFKKREADCEVPTEFELQLAGGGYTVTGKVTEQKFLEAVEVLGQVSPAIRWAIKAFYANPYMFRWLAKVELDVKGPGGQTEHISALAVMETNYF